MKNLLSFIVFIGFYNSLIAQVLPPNVLCVEDTINNYIAINWADVANCGSNFESYHIWGANQPQGPFELIADVFDPTVSLYIHSTPDLQYGAVFYYMTQECGGVLSVPSDTIANTEPQPPTLDYVTVNENNIVELYWNMDDYPDYFGTKIFRVFNSSIQSLTTIDGTAITYYLDLTSSPSQKVESYDLAARDGCGEPGSYSGNLHSTILFRAEEFICDGYFNFSWTPYVGWETNGIVDYKVYKNDEVISTLSGNSTDLSFQYQLLPQDTIDLCFRVEATSVDGYVSSSNRTCYAFSTPPMPFYINWKRASVINENDVELEWFNDPGKSAYLYNINRGNTPTDLETVIGYNPIIALPAEMDTTDLSALATSRAYYYQVEARDTCVAQIISGLVKTIYVKGKDNFNLTNTLEWNAYEIENGTVTAYNIYREDLGFTDPLITVDGSVLEYTDNVTGMTPLNSRFCYQIEAIYNLIDPNGNELELNSLSNTTCISQNSRIIVPNIFTPNGTENIFKPIVLYPDMDSYTMMIFNRWGEILFTSTDPEQGWTGSDPNGKTAPQGVYSYVIKMNSMNGIPLEKKGTVTLIR